MKKKRVLLIAPGQLFFTSTKHPVTHSQLVINESLLCLFSYLKAHSAAEVEVLDIPLEWPVPPENTEELQAFEAHCARLIAAHTYDIAAISCLSTYSYQAAVTVGRLCREANPGATVVVGGWHTLSHPQDFVFRERIFDFVVQGSGEKSLLALAEGQLHSSGATKIIVGEPLTDREFAELTYDFAGYRAACPSRYGPYFDTLSHLTLSISRGCPGACSFCGNRLLRRRHWQALGVSRALAIIGLCAATFPALSTVIFSDPMFGLDRTWRRAFLSGLAKEYPQLTFPLITRIDLLEEEDIRLLAAVRTFAIFGLESLSPRMLAIMRKTEDVDSYLARVRRTLPLLRHYGVPHELKFILDHPGETEAGMEQTRRGLTDLLIPPTRIDAFRYMHLPQFALDYPAYQTAFNTEFQGELEWWRARTWQSYETLEARYVCSKQAGEDFSSAKDRLESTLADVAAFYGQYRRTWDNLAATQNR